MSKTTDYYLDQQQENANDVDTLAIIRHRSLQEAHQLHEEHKQLCDELRKIETDKSELWKEFQVCKDDGKATALLNQYTALVTKCTELQISINRIYNSVHSC